MRKSKHFKQWLSFEKARHWSRSLNLSSEREWRVYRKQGLPAGIPTNPNRTYKDEWRGWPDWLGSQNHVDNPSKFYQRKFKSYKDCQKWAIKEKIKSQTEWKKLSKNNLLPKDIPSSPDKKYVKEWTSWGDFLKTGFVAYKLRKWLPYKEVKKWAKVNNLRNREEWFEARRKGILPENIPVLLDKVYKQDWEGWENFFGIKLKGGASYIESIIENELKLFLPVDANIRSLPLIGGKKKRVDIVISKLNIVIEYDGYHWHKNSDEKDIHDTKALNSLGWKVIRLRENPLSQISADDISINPYDTPFLKVAAVLERIISLNILNRKQITKVKRYLNNKKILSKNIHFDSKIWLTFKKARSWVRKQNISSETEWRHFRRSLPKNIPSTPNVVYQQEWISWGDWLGTNSKYTPPNSFRDFNSARAWSRKQNLSSSRDWFKLCQSSRIPKDIPRSPYSVYDEWISWGDWLFGNVKKGERKPWLSFSKARAYVHELKLTSESEWRIFVKTRKMPANIPKSPRAFDKNEWISWPNWLGTSNKSVKKITLTYDYVSLWARKERINSSTQWRALVRKGELPSGFPSDPARVYKSQWQSWKAFLGKPKVS